MESETEKKLIDIIRENITLKVPADTLGRDHNLRDIGINSIGFIKLVIKLEKEFQFKFNEDDLVLGKFVILNDLIDYVEKRTG